MEITQPDLPEPAEPAEAGSTFLIALHVLVWTALSCGVIAVMVIVLVT